MNREKWPVYAGNAFTMQAAIGAAEVAFEQQIKGVDQSFKIDSGAEKLCKVDEEATAGDYFYQWVIRDSAGSTETIGAPHSAHRPRIIVKSVGPDSLAIESPKGGAGFAPEETIQLLAVSAEDVQLDPDVLEWTIEKLDGDDVVEAWSFQGNDVKVRVRDLGGEGAYRVRLRYLGVLQEDMVSFTVAAAAQ